MNITKLAWHSGSPVGELALGEIASHQISRSPSINLENTEKVWKAASLLPSYLESFSDSLLVLKEKTPVGLVGGREMMKAVFFNPTFDLLDETSVEAIARPRLNFADMNTTLSNVISIMQRQRLAFVVVPQKDKNSYSCVSSRTLIEVCTRCKTDMAVRDMPENHLVVFGRDDSVKDIFVSMFLHQTRRLVLKDSSYFINDRIIIEHIVTKLNYLDGLDDFLGMPISEFPLKKINQIPTDTPIPELCKKMLSEESPCFLAGNQIVTPWDIVTLLK